MSDDTSVLISTRSTEFANKAHNANSDAQSSYWVFDLVVQPAEQSQLPNTGGLKGLNLLDARVPESRALVFLHNCMNLVIQSRKAAIVRFIFSHTRGHPIRSDSLIQRLECCSGIERVESFIPPLHAIPNVAFQDLSLTRVPEVLSYAIGGLLVQGFEARSLESEFLRLDNEFKNRFSFPWLQANHIPR